MSATMVRACAVPAESRALLVALLGDLPTESVRHAATRSAAETQAVLPPGVLVQKTVTVVFGNASRTRVLWTGVGDFSIERDALRQVADRLHLARRAAKHATINPAWIDPVAAYDMEPGMVSPFVAPDRTPGLCALVAQTLLPVWDASLRVAISLSLHESLLVPLPALPVLLRGYHARAYPPHAPLIEIAGAAPFAPRARETNAIPRKEPV